MSEAPLAGLVLTGGRSRRMGTDKATIRVAGDSQLERTVRQLSRHCSEVYVSVRADQRGDPERARYPQIVDRIADVGPVAGILAAMETRPDRAWLVVAVDLPRLDEGTVAMLVARRDATAVATAYRSSSDGLPEPLCAIWEPSSFDLLRAFVETRRLCPRKFLLTHETRLLDLDTTDALANANTPEEHAELTQNHDLPNTP